MHPFDRRQEVQGWHDESIQDHFQKQREIADSPSTDLERVWFGRMKIILREIDDGLQRCVTGRIALNFLDLG